MKPHQVREMVNELRDVAVIYSDTDQLRDRISHVVHKYLKQEHGKLVWVTDRSWMYIDESQAKEERDAP